MITVAERYNKINNSNIYSDLISNDAKSTLIVIGIDEEIYSHETRKQILIDIDDVINSFRFDLESINSNIITFKNSNVLSITHLDPILQFNLLLMTYINLMIKQIILEKVYHKFN